MRTVLAFAITLLISGSAHSDELRELMNSDSFSRLNHMNIAAQYSSNDGTNLAKVTNSYIRGGGPGLIVVWLGRGAKQLKGVEQNVKINEHSAVLRSKYTSYVTKRTIEQLVMIPKQSKELSVQYNLLSDYTQLEPPHLAVESSREVEIQGFKASIYRTKDQKKTSLLIKLPKQSIVNFTINTKDDEGDQELILIARSFDLRRLAGKISS